MERTSRQQPLDRSIRIRHGNVNNKALVIPIEQIIRYNAQEKLNTPEKDQKKEKKLKETGNA